MSQCGTPNHELAFRSIVELIDGCSLDAIGAIDALAQSLRTTRRDLESLRETVPNNRDGLLTQVQINAAITVIERRLAIIVPVVEAMPK